MIRQTPFLLALAGLGLSATAAAYAEDHDYIWPNDKIDILEYYLYEHSGYHVNTPATFVVPCGNVPFGEGRNGPAEWIRTAYHDMATADVVAGTGGIDASIGFELDRDENPGKGFNETLFNLRGYMTARSSMADLIAMGAVFAVGGCSGSKLILPFRGGRVDAGGPGPTGVPKPEQALDSHLASFERQGFTKDEMIGLVACGHTLGGVHGVDFPEIVDVVNDTSIDDNTIMFDTSTVGDDAFDNKVASEFVSNTTQNPLASGHNETTRSDARIFNADGGALINKMAASNAFFLDTCRNLLERMINTVPKSVTLGKVIDIIPVKPSSLYATIVPNTGTLNMTGLVRLVDRHNSLDIDTGRQVKIHFRPRSGGDCSEAASACPTADAHEFAWSRNVYKFGSYPVFKKYAFAKEMALAQGVSAFDVEVIDTDNGTATSTMHTNGGHGFPFDDSIVTQPLLSCHNRADVGDGAFNLTVAIRDDTKLTSLGGRLQIPKPLDALVPAIASTPLDFKKVGAVPGANYTLYNVVQFPPLGTYTLTYDLVASNATHQEKRLFNDVIEIRTCPPGFADGVGKA